MEKSIKTVILVDVLTLSCKREHNFGTRKSQLALLDSNHQKSYSIAIRVLESLDPALVVGTQVVVAFGIYTQIHTTWSNNLQEKVNIPGLGWPKKTGIRFVEV